LLRKFLPLALLSALAFAQLSSENVSPEVRATGTKLKCLCGTCSLTVGTCNMIGCHYASPARERIGQMQAEGKTDEQILEVFVAENGTQALSAPPNEGFNALSWWMPAIATVLGAFAVIGFIRRSRKSETAHPHETDSAVLDRYKDEIEKDTEKLDG
jgi:cytochrome c-type biogenesis protein CcmH/NrfF